MQANAKTREGGTHPGQDAWFEHIGKALPYGVHDVAGNVGWVNVGTGHHTGAFAVDSIRRRWFALGMDLNPELSRLMITAVGGGSNGSRVKLWKTELQALARETGLHIQVSHPPPGTGKWNRIEHRLFSSTGMNRRGHPLRDVETNTSLIAATTTKSDLKAHWSLDEAFQPKGIRVADE